MCVCTNAHFHCVAPLNSLTHTSVVRRGTWWRTSRVPLVYPASFLSLPLTQMHTEYWMWIYYRGLASLKTCMHANRTFSFSYLYKVDRQSDTAAMLSKSAENCKWNYPAVIRFIYGDSKWPLKKTTRSHFDNKCINQSFICLIMLLSVNLNDIISNNTLNTLNLRPHVLKPQSNNTQLAQCSSYYELCLCHC